MVDLSKHLARAKQALDRRSWAMVIEIADSCLEVDPTNLEVYQLLLDAARRQAQESDKKSMFSGLRMPAMTKDPIKQLTHAMKRVAGSPDAKSLANAGEAAEKVFRSGVKPMLEVAIYLYEQMHATQMFNAEVLWNLSNLYYEQFQAKKDVVALDLALKTLAELERAMPQHKDAARTLKNWEARKSMEKRGTSAGQSSDYTSQLASSEKARRQEMMNRLIRTEEDGKEVLAYIEDDIKQNANDKALWLKKGDIHRRFGQHAEARAAYLKGQELDQFDFVIAMRLGDLTVDEQKAKIAAAMQAGQDATPLKQQLLQFEIDEFKKRIDRQPTEMTHHFSLGLRLLQTGQIELAAAEFQRTVADPKYRNKSHRYLGFCFSKKNLLDLAVQQYTSYLSLVEDDRSDEAKEVRYLRARQLEDLGKRDDAMADYSKLVEIDLGFKDAAARLAKLRGM
jgi:tetratricopeptide (TPR) repeat protein